MPVLPEAGVLLVGKIVGDGEPRFEWDEEKGRRTNKRTGTRVLVQGDVPGAPGFTAVTVPMGEYEGPLTNGAAVAWYVRFGAWLGRSAGGETTVRFVAAADENAAQAVHEYVAAMTRKAAA